MGNHRADVDESRREPSLTPPVTAAPTPTAGGTPYVGKRARQVSVPEELLAPSTYVGRRAARPAAGADVADTAKAASPAPVRVTVPEPATATPYVARRATAAGVLTAERTEAPAVVVLPASQLLTPLTPARPIAEPAPSRESLIDTGHIARVLADLEPVDHTTSFASDDTEIIPLQPAAAPAGRRRAPRKAPANPFVRRLPSLPLAAGVAVLGIAVAGTIGTASTDLADAPTSVGQIGAVAASGTSGTGSVRGPVVSRDADRSDLSSAVEGRNERIASVDKQAAARSADLAANRWVLPVDPSLYRLTARFGEYGLWASYHTGLDFAAAPGTPIMAIAAGTVTFAGYDGAYGNKTVVTLADGTEIWYCHQTSFGVSAGDEVSPGEQIGTVGSTGHVTGPHVHIEVRPGGGDPVDPFAAMVAHGVTP